MQSLTISIFSQKLSTIHIWLTASASIIQVTACTIQGYSIYYLCMAFIVIVMARLLLKNQIKITVQIILLLCYYSAPSWIRICM